MRITQNNGLDFIQYRAGKDNTYEIFDIKVGSERTKGIGRELVQEMIKKANPRIIYGFTRASNENARLFYKALGFREVELKNFYENEDAIMIIYENSLYRKI